MTDKTQARLPVTPDIEAIAQFLHDEGGFGDAWDNHTWPEHPDDTGQRDGGWVKIVPKDVQAQFRDVARRMHGMFAALTPSPCPGDGMLVDQAWLDRRQAEPDANVEAGAPIRQHVMPGDPAHLLQTTLQWYLKFDFGYPHSVRESNIAAEAFKDGYRAALTPSAPKAARDPVTGRYAYSGDLERLCECGHALGFHLHGGHECLNSETGSGTPCSCKKFVPATPSALSEKVVKPGFQAEVGDWMLECFGPEIAADHLERGDRWTEEALELAQTIPGFTAERAHALVDYVFTRPVGERGQEVGGSMVTLAALCNSFGINIAEEAERELARAWTKVEAIRAKQAAKPTGSALPVAAPSALSGDAGERASYLIWSNEHCAWWAPNRCGYTREADRAGRYDRSEAMRIAGTGRGGWMLEKNPSEIAIPEADALEQALHPNRLEAWANDRAAHQGAGEP